MITMKCNGQTPGTMEYLKPVKTAEGLQVHIMSASSFIIAWAEPVNIVLIVLLEVIVFCGFAIAVGYGDSDRRMRKNIKVRHC